MSIRQAAEAYKRRLGQKLLHSRLHPLYYKLAGSAQVREYRRFRAALEQSGPAPESLRKQMESWQRRPRVSLLMAVHNPNPDWLAQAVRSVAAQIYPDWELLMSDDASSPPPRLPEAVNSDARIRFMASPERVGISGALNRALAAATGDYIAILDHDDFLSTDALYRMVEALQQAEFDLLYSDEEYVNAAGEPMRPNFKPDWSPELLSNCMYIGHLIAVSRPLIEEVGGFRSEFDGAQDYDLALRLSDRPIRVAHVPWILYRWRQHDRSIAWSSAAKPWASEAGRRAAVDAIRRRGWDALALDAASPSRYQIHRKVERKERASIVVSAHSGAFEEWTEALRSATGYGDTEFIAADRTSSGRNAAARQAAGSYLVFVQDVRPLAPDWLEALLAQAERREVGATGARLIYPDGSLQHSGLVTGMLSGVGHCGRRLYRSDYWPWLDYTRDVSAVSSACMAIRRDVFQDAGGFAGEFRSDYADADLCLRLRDAGYRTILEPQATLVIRNSPENPAHDEADRWRAKWGCRAEEADPYFTRFLRLDREDASLRFP